VHLYELGVKGTTHPPSEPAGLPSSAPPDKPPPEPAGDILTPPAPRAAAPGVRRWLLAALAVTVLGAAGAVSWPHWKNFLPDTAQRTALKQRVALMQEEAATLRKGIDDHKRELADAAQSARNTVGGLEEQLRAATAGAEKQTLQIALWEARNARATAEELDRRHQLALAGANGLSALESQLQEASDARESGAWETARPRLDASLRAYRELHGLPDRLKTELQSLRAAQVARLGGQWALADCKEAAIWTVKDPNLTVLWPKQGVFEEKILDASDAGVTTVILTPDAYRHRLYRYQVGDAGLTATEISSGRQETLKSCNAP
jgi:hypothetical protein